MKFRNGKEKEFLDAFNTESVAQVRLGLLTGAVVYALFGFLDFFALPQSVAIAWIIRYLLVVPLMVAGIYFSYKPDFGRHLPLVTFTLAAVSGLGHILMMGFSEPSEHGFFLYQNSLMLLVFWSHILLRMQFKIAWKLTIFLIAIYEFVSLYIQNILTYPSGDILFLNNNFYIISANIFAVFAAYLIEKNARNSFAKKKSIEKEKEKIQQALEQINQEKDVLKKEKLYAQQNDALKLAFIANMSHEIRTPMNGILGFLELLDDENIEADERNYYIKIINKSGEKLLDIINDIIDTSRISFDQIKVYKSPFSINELLDDLMTYFVHERNFCDDNVEIIARKDMEDIDSLLITDKFRLKQIFINLIGNSLKYTENGQVSYGYKVLNSSTLQCFVFDTGIGIDPAIYNHLFEPFKQGDNSMDRKYGGAGLGLAITKYFVELLGGELWFESKLGRGTQFFFTVPIGAERENKLKLKRKPSLKDKFPQRNATILIVEDDEHSAFYFKKLLDKNYSKVILCENAEQGIKYIRSGIIPDLVIMDIQLPGMSGIEATKIIKQIEPNVPIIVQTAFSMNQEKEQAISVGADDFLIKPVSHHKLALTINKLLALHEFSNS